MTSKHPAMSNPNLPSGKTGADMPLVAHLTELRSRLLRIVCIWLVIFAALFYFANDIYSFVSEPLRALMPAGTSMIATDVAAPFLTPVSATHLTHPTTPTTCILLATV